MVGPPPPLRTGPVMVSAPTLETLEIFVLAVFPRNTFPIVTALIPSVEKFIQVCPVVGTITATSFSGALNDALSGNATNLSGNPAISVSSINLNGGNITNGGAITATTFNGALNGSAVNLSGNPSISVSSINVNGGNISSVGTITASTFSGNLSGNANTATNAGNAITSNNASAAFWNEFLC